MDMRTRVTTTANSKHDDNYLRTAEKPLAQSDLIQLLNEGFFDDLDKLDYGSTTSFSLDSTTLEYLVESGVVTNETVLRDLRRMRRDRLPTTIRPVKKGDVPNQGTDGTAQSDCSGSGFGAVGSLDEAINSDRASRVVATEVVATKQKAVVVS